MGPGLLLSSLASLLGHSTTAPRRHRASNAAGARAAALPPDKSGDGAGGQWSWCEDDGEYACGAAALRSSAGEESVAAAAGEAAGEEVVPVDRSPSTASCSGGGDGDGDAVAMARW